MRVRDGLRSGRDIDGVLIERLSPKLDIMDIAVLKRERKRSFLIQRTTEIAALENRVIAGTIVQCNERAPAIERLIRTPSEVIAVQLICPGLREDFDPSEADGIVLRGKGVLVHLDFANGRFRRQLSGRESIHVHLAAIRTGSGARKRLQVLR